MSFPTIQKIVRTDRQQDFNPQDEVTIMIDGTDISLLNGKNSYLHFSVKLDGNFKANLDRNGGGGFSILERVNIFSGDGSTLLEQLDDMPVWMGIKNFYDITEGLENSRNLLEGLVPFSGIQSPYFNGDNLGKAGFTWVECCLPLYQSGVLFGNAFPAIATGGLMIKISLGGAQKSVQAVGVQSDYVNGFVSDRKGLGAPAVLADLPANAGVLASGAVPAGEPGLPPDVPSCFEINADIAAGAGTTTLTITTTTAGQPVGIGAPAVPANMRPNVNAPTNAADFPYVEGSHIYYLDDVGVVVDCGAITGVVLAAGIYTITFAATATTVATAANHNPVWVSISNTINTMTYVVRDLELVCSAITPDQKYFGAMMSRMKSGEGYSLDIKSFNLYRNNQFKGQVKSQELIPTNERRARALLQVQIFPSLSWTTSFYRGISDWLSTYQYQIANRNVPQLAVSVDREYWQNLNSWNANADAERVKCLEASKIDVKSELAPANNFCFGREVARVGHSANLLTNDVRITQAWGVPQTIGGVVTTILPQKDKLLYTFVRHFRKINMKPGNVVVSF